MKRNSVFSGRREVALVVLLCAAEFLIALDFSIVNVALPDIRHALKFSPDALQWVIGAYALTFGGFLLLGSRIADKDGRRLAFILGLIGFGSFSLGAGLSGSSMVRIAFRALQGLAAAWIASSAFAILTTEFNEDVKRNAALHQQNRHPCYTSSWFIRTIGCIAGAAPSAPIRFPDFDRSMSTLEESSLQRRTGFLVDRRQPPRFHLNAGGGDLQGSDDAVEVSFELLFMPSAIRFIMVPVLPACLSMLDR